MTLSKRRDDQLFVAPCQFAAACTFEQPIVAIAKFTFSKVIDASATGIQLGAADADHTLDNYNKNTFVPKLQDASFSDAEGQTYTTQLGRFTEIGDRVFFDLHLDVLSSGTLQGSGPTNVILEGAPAMKTGVTDMGTCLVTEASSMNLPGPQGLTGRIDTATQSIRLMRMGSTAGHSSVSITQFENGAFIMSGSYVKA